MTYVLNGQLRADEGEALCALFGKVVTVKAA